MAHATIPARLMEQARIRPYRPAYYVRRSDRWVPTDWSTYVKQVRAAAKALVANGFEVGDTVSILGFNCAEWVIFDLAAMCAGGAPAGIYTTCSAPEVAYIVSHSESKIVLLENKAQWEKINAERAQLGHLVRIVLLDGYDDVDDELVVSWDAFLASGADVDDNELDSRIAALESDQLATLIYTSGTTGPPKGVMLTHENLAWTAGCALELADFNDKDWGISYLPLSHIAEQMFTIHLPITAGASIYFAESIEKVPDNIKEVQPTFFFGVPRIWEKFHAGVAGKLASAPPLKKKLADWAMRVGRETLRHAEAKKPLPLLLSLQYKLAGKLFYSKVKPAIGMANIKIAVSAAAPIAKEVLEFFSGLDIVVHEVYGQSEDTGPTTFNRPGSVKLGTVGQVLPGVEAKIADDGEILVRGPNVFKGYFKEPEATAETLIDGWLYSGDLGQFDADGFLSITGRKKEIIITAGGKNVAPKNIEAAIKNHPLVTEAVVIGDRRKFLTCLVCLEPEASAAFAKEHGIDVNEVATSAQARNAIQGAIDEMNKEFARVEQVKKFAILPRPLSVEDGELTPTLKVKRRVVNERYADVIESMYAE